MSKDFINIEFKLNIEDSGDISSLIKVPSSTGEESKDDKTKSA
jgi:hypothetical protein